MGAAFKVQPFAEHIPDSGPDPDHKAPHTVEQGAGQIELGFYIGEHRVVLSSLKAGAFTDLFDKGDPTSGKPAKGLAASSSSSKKSPDSGDDGADDK
jgi:hypothetical protein